MNLIPAAIVAPQSFSVQGASADSPWAALWTVALGAILGLLGLAGVFIALVIGRRSGAITIRADAAGLTGEATLRTKLVP